MHKYFQKDCADILVTKLRDGSISRRTFVTGLGLLAGTSALGLGIGRVEAAADELVFVNWGGDAITAMDKAFGKPFTEATGIPVKFDGSGPTEGAIAAQAKGGKPAWDLVDCEPFSAQSLGKKDVMEAIDYNVVDRAKTRSGFGWEYAASAYFYSYVIAYDKTKYKTPPASMADFFDVEKFPGKRAMYKWGAGMLEAALLADGVAPADLYPLDVDRALAKIATLKDHVAGFWGGGAESQSLLLNGDASMAIIWNTRASLLDKDTGGDISYTWSQGLVAPGSTGVLKNNPGGAEAAMRYIAAAQDPQRQVMLFELLGNGPANPAADALIPAEQARHNPVDPANYSQQISLNTDWYEENYGSSLDKYLKLISS